MKPKKVRSILIFSALILLLSTALSCNAADTEVPADKAIAVEEAEAAEAVEAVEVVEGVEAAEIPETIEIAESNDTVPLSDAPEQAAEKESDVIGWIKVPGTDIDYPVVHCKDNAFYLDHDLNKASSPDGAIFLDMRADIKKPSQSLSIYGHHRESGGMFSALHGYKDLSFYKSRPVFEFDSLYAEGVYKIFSVFYMAGNRDDEFFYYYPKADFESDRDFMNHIIHLKARSIFVTDVDIVPRDRLVLLTCCTYETDNLRLVIAGRKVRPGETAAVDTSGARENPEALYPKKWYDAKGLTAPVVVYE